jgi:hypothetical protein
MSKQIKNWHQRRYTAWYDPAFRITSAFYEHMAEDDRLRAYIEHIKISIWEKGLENPLLVTRKNGKSTIHPGKCRAKALLSLGRSIAPAVVVDFDRIVDSDGIPEGCTFLDNLEDAQSWFSGDCVVEMTHRGLTVKKKR